MTYSYKMIAKLLFCNKEGMHFSFFKTIFYNKTVLAILRIVTKVTKSAEKYKQLYINGSVLFAKKSVMNFHL